MIAGNTNGGKHINATYFENTKTLTVTGEGWTYKIQVPTSAHLDDTLRMHGLMVKGKWKSGCGHISCLLQRRKDGRND